MDHSTDPLNGSVEITIRSADSRPRDFSLRIRAFTTNGDDVTKTVALSFSQPLECTLTEMDALIPNHDIRFQATAVTGEPLVVSEVTGSWDATLVSANGVNPITVRFATSGPKVVSLKARTASGRYCNNGNPISRAVFVRSRLSGCSVVTGPNPAPVGTPVRVEAVLNENVVSGPFTTTGRVYQTRITELSPVVGLSQFISFDEVGTFLVEITIRNHEDGTVVSCSAYHNSTLSQGLHADVYNIARHEGFSLGSSGFESWTPVQSFVASNIDVPTRHYRQGFPQVVGLTEYFAIRYVGRLYVANAGIHQFKTISDDGVILEIDDQPVINDDSIHASRQAMGSVYLSAGYHKFKLKYYQGPRYQLTLQLFWTTPVQPDFTIVPAGVFSGPVNWPSPTGRVPAIRTADVYCASHNYRYAECVVAGSTRVLDIDVIRRDSSSGCSIDYSFGIHTSDYTRIWVHHGCRALLRVTYWE
jgi:hypothetical protein